MIKMKYEKDYFGFVYLWYDRKRKWFCLGSHMGSLEDGYSSSTGFFEKALTKRPQDMKRRILYFESSANHSALLEAEQKWIDLIKHEELDLEINRRNKTVRYYNRKRKAQGIDSEVARIIAYKRVMEGTHHFLSGEHQKKWIKEGKWHTLGPELNRKRVENGTHNWLGKKHPSKVGEKNGQAKLTEAIVREIKISNESQKMLAERYGIDQSIISRIRNGKA